MHTLCVIFFSHLTCLWHGSSNLLPWCWQNGIHITGRSVAISSSEGVIPPKKVLLQLDLCNIHNVIAAFIVESVLLATRAHSTATVLIYWMLLYAGAVAIQSEYLGQHYLQGQSITSQLCYGNESRLLDCRYYNSTCSRSGGVYCQGETVAGME